MHTRQTNQATQLAGGLLQEAKFLQMLEAVDRRDPKLEIVSALADQAFEFPSAAYFQEAKDCSRAENFRLFKITPRACQIQLATFSSSKKIWKWFFWVTEEGGNIGIVIANAMRNAEQAYKANEKVVGDKQKHGQRRAAPKGTMKADKLTSFGEWGTTIEKATCPTVSRLNWKQSEQKSRRFLEEKYGEAMVQSVKRVVNILALPFSPQTSIKVMNAQVGGEMPNQRLASLKDFPPCLRWTSSHAASNLQGLVRWICWREHEGPVNCRRQLSVQIRHGLDTLDTLAASRAGMLNSHTARQGHPSNSRIYACSHVICI